MARAIAHPDAPTPGQPARIFSFGRQYHGTITKVGPRTITVAYTNKSGNRWELNVKRLDVAAPSANAEFGKVTRQLRSVLKREQWVLKNAQNDLARHSAPDAVERANEWETAHGYPARYTAQHLAQWVVNARVRIENAEVTVAQAQAALDAHLASKAK